MLNFVKSLGKLVVRLYNAEARKLNTKARKDAAEAQRLAKRVQVLTDGSITRTAEVAKVAAQAQSLSKFFN